MSDDLQDIPKQELTRAGQPDETLGEQLARVREGQGLTVREVAMKLAIDPAVIEALEAERFRELGAPIYVRGYLVRYARLLGLAEQPLVEAYRARMPAEPPPLKPTTTVTLPSGGRPWGARWLGYLLLLAGVLWIGWMGLQEVSLQEGDFAEQSQDNGTLSLPRTGAGEDGGPGGLPLPTAETVRRPGAIDAPAADEPPPEPVTAGSGAPPTILESLPTPEAEPGAGPVAEAPAVPAEEGFPVEPVPAGSPDNLPVEVPTEAPPGEAAPPAEEVVPEVPAGQDRLVMRFSADCWVDVKDADDNRLAYGIMKADTVQTLIGPAPFSLVLGNAQAVSLTINGRSIAPDRYVPGQGTVARVVLEAPAG